MNWIITALIFGLIGIAEHSRAGEKGQYKVIGTSIMDHPPIAKGIKVRIKNNVLTLGYRYSNNETCLQFIKFDESGIITGYSEKGICGSQLATIDFESSPGRPSVHRSQASEKL